jgi:hypothetical protein
VTSSRHLKYVALNCAASTPTATAFFAADPYFLITKRLSISLATVHAKMSTVEDVRQRENEGGEEEEEEEEVLDYVVEGAAENDDAVGPRTVEEN